MKRISIVIPAYNEADNIRKVYDALASAFKDIPYDLELIFVDDGSTDGTYERITALAGEDERVKYVSFEHNFGQQAATAAGLAYATGDAAMLMDADLQHPPRFIPDFIRAWEEGNAVAFGVRRTREGDSPLRRFVSWSFGKLTRGSTLPSGTADFCIIDRKLIDAFKALPPQKVMTRIRIARLGGKRAYVPFDIGQRDSGVPKYNFKKLIELFVTNVIMGDAISPGPLYAVANTNLKARHESG